MDHLGYDIMIKNACLMAGRQAGAIGVLTVLAKKIDILAIVAYDENVEMVSKEFKIPLFETIHNGKFLKKLSQADLLICVHGKEIVPEEILNLPKINSINVHPCLYKYRGKNPVERLLKDGNAKASVGVHYMTKKIDAGKIIAEEFVNVSEIENVEAVYNILYPYYSLSLSIAIDKINKKL